MLRGQRQAHCQVKWLGTIQLTENVRPGTIQLTESVHLPQTGLCNGSKVLQGYRDPILELWGHCTTHILGF